MKLDFAQTEWIIQRCHNGLVLDIAAKKYDYFTSFEIYS